MSSFAYSLPAGGDTRRSAGHRFLGVLGLVATLIVGAVVLYRLAGPPHLPIALPTWTASKAVLTGSDVPYAAITYLFSTAAWLIWFWVVGSILLRLLVPVAEILTRGAAWARSLRALSDRVTLPVIRKLVDGAVVAVTVAQLVSRTTAIAAAAPAPATPSATLAHAASHAPAPTRPATHLAAPAAVTYRVQDGDNLWAIAEQFYGDGNQFPRIIAANADRPMGNGQYFPPTGVIKTGWALLIPDPTRRQGAPAPAATQQHVECVVKDGDTLRAIAARYYGDEARWPEIFQANEGVARLPDGRVLTNPDLIWPGLSLTIPGVAPAIPASAPSVPSPAHVVTPPAPPSPVQKVVPVPPQLHAATHAASAATATTASATTAQATTTATVGAAASPTSSLASAPTPAPAVPPVSATSAPVIRAMPGTPPQVPPLVPAGLAVLGAAGGLVLLARRRYRTSLSEPPVPPDHEAGIPIRAGWADPAHARTFANRLDGGTEPALLVAEQVLHCLQQAGIEDVTLVTVREGRHSMALTLRAGLATQERLLQIGPDVAQRLGASGAVSRTSDHDMLLQLGHLALLRVAVRPSGSPLSSIPLLALGVLPRGEAFHVNWQALGHVLIASTPGGANIVLANVLTTLAARCHPDQLRLYTIAPREALAPPLLDLPHQWSGVVAPTDSPGVEALLDELQSELECRMEVGSVSSDLCSARKADVILVLPELADLPNSNHALALLAAHGPAFGMHIIAATTRQEVLTDATLASFGTRLVMRTLEEAASVRLLGRPDAADLGGGGDLFLRIEGRDPVRLQSFRVEPEHLKHLVDLMHAAFRDSARSQEPAPPSGTDGDTVAEQADEAPLANVPVAPDSVILPLVPSANGSAPVCAAAWTAPSAGMTVSVNGHVVAAPATACPPSSARGASEDLPPEATRARIQIRCFSELEVSGDGRPLSAQGQNLPWELLILLAVQPSAGVSKQELLRLLWPNIDQELGDRRLRAAMVRLRVVLAEQLPDLPADVVRGQRNGTCHLDNDLVWSDSQHFLSLCRQATRVPREQTISVLEQARAAYCGELFTQPSFDWMDRRVRGVTLRERYREDHATVTLQLAERYEAEGRPALAVPLYAELLHATPTLQEVARRLYRCCAQLGDHSTLQREHARLIGALEHVRGTVHPGQAHAYTLEPETLAVYKEALAAQGGISASKSTP